MFGTLSSVPLTGRPYGWSPKASDRNLRLASEPGLDVSRRKPESTWARIRSTSTESKCGEVSAIRKRSKASSRVSLSMRSEPRKVSRDDEKLSSMARRSSRSWNVLESRSPEPSSRRSATMLPTPGLPAGSCEAPPPKAYSIAISGTVASCTNQASMPPGEIRCWIFAAARDGVGAIVASAAQATKTSANRRVKIRANVTNASPRAFAWCP